MKPARPQCAAPGPGKRNRLMAPWAVERRHASAAEHVAASFPARRLVRILELARPALVLGSGQPATDVDDVAAETADVEVARRRSGGGAVLVVPGEALWLDVVVPADDPLWSDDVRRSFHWLGGAFTAALGKLGVRASWHDGPMLHSRWSKLVCFAGIGPGEVLVAGHKVVGFSSRRVRSAALFQCLALLRQDPARLTGLLTGDIPVADLDGAAGLGGVDLAALESVVLDQITSL